MKIVVVDKIYITDEDKKKLEAHGEVVIYNDVPNQAVGIERIKDADIVIDNWFDMPAAVINASPKLRMISVAAIGYEWVDLAAAKLRNITVSNCAAYCAEAVAEHTIGLLLSAARLSQKASLDIKNGKWDPPFYQGIELKGKTLGLLGYGSIGKRVAEIAQNGIGMNVIYFNSSTPKNEFETLLRQSDAIAVTLPLNENTKGLLGEAEFQQMKNGVVIVNTGRGAVIQEDSLIRHIQSGKIFAAGLDVIVNEPMKKDDPLFSLPNVIVTPHIAFNTEDSRKNLSRLVTDNVIAFIEKRPQNVVS